MIAFQGDVSENTEGPPEEGTALASGFHMDKLAGLYL
jgi:hypothetical protein